MGLPEHDEIIRRLRQRLATVMVADLALRLIGGWLLVWGTVALVLRMTTSVPVSYLLTGALALIPLTIAAYAATRHRFPTCRALNALLDRHNECGGLVMAAGDGVDSSAWQADEARLREPEVRWQSRRPRNLAVAGAAFVALALTVPAGKGLFINEAPLEIGDVLGELEEQIQVLEEERVLEEEKAEELAEKLKQLGNDASGEDPARTWEAMDHISDKISQAADARAEEALRNMSNLTQAEAMAGALGKMGEEFDMSANETTEAMRALADLLEKAAREDKLLEGTIPEELLKQLKSGQLTPAQMAELAKLLKECKGGLSKSLERLCKARLIDAETLEKLKKCSSCGNGDKELLAFLCEQGNQCTAEALLLACCPGRGGVSRGRGDAAMTWTDGTDEQGATFKEQALPTPISTDADGSQLVGISMSAPEANKRPVSTANGQLKDAAAGGGSARRQKLLPRHRRTVQKFFSRGKNE